MAFFISVLFFLILLRVVSKSKLDTTSRLSLLSFISVWLFSAVSAYWNPGKMIPVSDYTYLLICLNVLCFTIGFYVFQPRYSGKNIAKEVSFRSSLECYINRIAENKLFYLLVIIAVIYTSSLIIINYRTMVFNQTLSEVRDSYFEDADALYGTGFSLLRDWFLTPLSKIAIPIFAYLLYKKRNILCLLLGIFLFEFSSLSGGRFGYLTILAGVFFILYCVLYFEDKRSRTLIVSVAGGIFIILMIAVTLFRSGVMDFSRSSAIENSEGLTDSYAIYITGPVGALDYAINNDYVTQIGGHTFGVATFCSIDRFLQPFLKVFNPDRLPLSNRFIGFKQDHMIRLFNNFGSYNALYTSILFFYVDFGLLGVAVLPLILGLLYGLLFRKFRNKPTFAMLVLLAWMFDVSLHSIFDFSLTSHMHPIMIMLLLFWHKRS